jgi:heparan-alpha-glucosaminide N-acetyltransferase
MTQTVTLKETSKRLLSVDAFRALNMLCMIFINDLSGVRGMPDWMDHAKGYEDSMGFADTIFPGFLFIVGLSIPLSVGRKIQKGESFSSISISILSRAFALLVMGFLHVNMENYNSHDAVLPEAVWEICITLGFFLIWLDYSDTLDKWKKYSLVGLGWLILLLMAFLFVGGKPGAPEGLDPQWWGILGIIGWSYLVCGFVFLLGKGKFSIMVAAMIIFALINIISHETVMHLYWSVIHYTPPAIPPAHKRLPHFSVWVIGDASSAFLVMAGTVVSLWYARLTAKNNQQYMWIALLIAGALAIAAGLFIRPYTEGISKIRSTPSWIFICSGISILVFELMIYLVDYKGKKNWFKFIWPAGTSTLTCYLLPYFQVAIMTLVHFRYPRFMDEGIGGFLRSWLVAFVIVWIGGILEKYRLRLKI